MRPRRKRLKFLARGETRLATSLLQQGTWIFRSAVRRAWHSVPKVPEFVSWALFFDMGVKTHGLLQSFPEKIIHWHRGYLENTQDSVKIGGLTLSGFKPVTNKLSCAWREPLWNRMDLLWFAYGTPKEHRLSIAAMQRGAPPNRRSRRRLSNLPGH